MKYNLTTENIILIIMLIILVYMIYSAIYLTEKFCGNLFSRTSNNDCTNIASKISSGYSIPGILSKN